MLSELESASTAWGRMSCGGVTMDSSVAIALQIAGIQDFAIQKDTQKGANHGDRAKTPDFVPRGFERCVHDVRRHLESQTGNKPARHLEPNIAPLTVGRARAQHRASDLENGLQATRCNNYDRDRLDAEGNAVSDCVQQIFHGARPRQLRAGAWETQRNPR